MGAQWPVVQRRLVALLPGLAGWENVEVYDGVPVTGNTPRDWCTVGYADLEDSSGTFTRGPREDDYRIPETGEVRCELVAWQGGTDLPAVRDRAFAHLDALDAAIRDDQTLGVLSPDATCQLVVDLVPAQTPAGAKVRVVFSVQYETRSD